MSTTTETQTVQSPPQITILTRVASIPLISSSFETLDHALSSNPYTRLSYGTAKGLSSTAYKYTEPIQIRLAPLITRADGFVNKAVDVVESRYPYPFRAKPEEVTEYVRERRQSATEYVHHSIDEKVKTPAMNVAAGIDHRFAPIVDYFQVAVDRIRNSDEPGPSTQDSKYQYQRALALTRQLYSYSGEQLKALHSHSVVLQRATETANNISTLAASSLTNAHTRVHQLSDNMLTELRKLQASTVGLSNSLQSTAASTVRDSASQIQSRIPPHVQQAFTDLSHNLSTAVTDLSNTLTAKDVPLQDKFSNFTSEVQERVIPLLGSFAKALTDALHIKSGSGDATPSNGNGTARKP